MAATGSAERGGDAKRGDGRGGVKLRKVGDFDSPVSIASARGFDDLLFVVERGGRIIVLRDGKRAGTFLDISDRVSTAGERGLFSVAFPPDYERSGRFYVYYTDRDGNIEVDHFRRSSPVRADEGTREEIITIDHPSATNHNGGTAAFGPDGKLYLATGDGGSTPENAQARGSLLGKLLRIDPRPSSKKGYAIPKGNPFRGRKGQSEIYSVGLRNPFRFSFDRRKPLIAIGDVGEGDHEEVDYLRVSEARGANFGWDDYEGRERRPGATLSQKQHDPPMHVYSNGPGGTCAITGGVTVHDDGLKSLRGRYVYADLCAGELRSFKPQLKGNRSRADRALGPSVDQPVGFGEDRAGHVYVASLNGPVYRLAPKK
jgi:glucose/arabinose dehydrogenase